jgi:hypothetical protein
MVRFIFLVLLSLCTACVAGDAAVKVRGKIVDQNGGLYENCVAKVSYAGRLLEEVSFAGDFEKTVIFHPVSSDPIIVLLSCSGTTATYEHQVTEMPESFGDYVDLGSIVLKRD